MLNIKYIVVIITLYAVGCSNEAAWNQEQLNILASFQLSNLDSSTSVKSNQYATNRQAVELGKAIFFDKRFSLDESLSCASCHQPQKAFTDGLVRAKGIHKTSRNTQTLLGVAHATWFYWDGRKDSLWSQALVPFEAEDEMAASRVKVLRVIGKDNKYLSQYEALYGEFPQVVFSQNISNDANPIGDEQARNAWLRIPVNEQMLINKAYVNIGKAIAAYERTLPIPKTKFDRYLDKLFDASLNESRSTDSFSEEELSGLKLFLDESKTHCLRCHNGPLFNDSEFHNIGTGNFKGKSLDFGRVYGISAVVQDEFNCLGHYSDAEPEDCLALRFLPNQVHDDLYGAFKTPTLRYLNQTSPYFHDGRFNTLEEVIDHYLSIQEGSTELPPLNLSDTEKKYLITFLNTLN